MNYEGFGFALGAIKSFVFRGDWAIVGTYWLVCLSLPGGFPAGFLPVVI
jgi:hypothetical protein